MFDSPLADWMPGKVVLHGWPYHGRIDYTRVSTTKYDPYLTLPTGRRFLLPFKPLVPGVKRPQVGTLLHFKAPDAPPIERTEEQLKVDLANGREWRNEALYSPRETMIYGQVPTVVGFYSWHWRWNKKTVLVDMGFSSCRFWEPLAIRGGRLLRRQETATVTYPKGAIQDLRDEYNLQVGSWSLMDVTRDGSRAILARFSPQTRPDQVSPVEAGDWCESPVEYWEAIPGYKDGAFTLEIIPLRTREQTNPPLKTSFPKVERRRIRPRGEESPMGQNEAGNPIFSVSFSPDFNVNEGMVEDNNFINGIGAEEYIGRILALYYDDAGTVQEITADCGIHTTYSSTLNPTIQSTPNIITRDSVDGQYASDIQQGSISFSFESDHRATQRAYLTIKNAGAVVGTVEAVTVSNWHVSGTSSGVTTKGIASFNGSNEAGSGSFNLTLRVDGKQLFSEGYSASLNNPSPYGFVRTPVVNNPQTGTAEVLNKPPFTGFKTAMAGDSNRTVEIWAGALRYAATMPACAAFVTDTKDKVETKVMHLGGAAIPKPGGSAPGFKTYAKTAEVFGSYNPITDKAVRDTDNPVFWI